MKQYKELGGGYSIVGKRLRHANAINLMDGTTDTQLLSAHHTLFTDDKGLQTEGIWFDRPFKSANDAIGFVNNRVRTLNARIQE
jgi:hypothetical protein